MESKVKLSIDTMDDRKVTLVSWETKEWDTDQKPAKAVGKSALFFWDQNDKYSRNVSTELHIFFRKKGKEEKKKKIWGEFVALALQEYVR